MIYNHRLPEKGAGDCATPSVSGSRRNMHQPPAGESPAPIARLQHFLTDHDRHPEHQDADHQKHCEQDLGDSRRGSSHSGKAQKAGQQCDHQEYECPT